jgi:hypothetical protein
MHDGGTISRPGGRYQAMRPSGGPGTDTFRSNATKDGGTTGDVFVDFVPSSDSIGILRSAPTPFP